MLRTFFGRKKVALLTKKKLHMVSEGILWKEKKSLLNVDLVSEDIYDRKNKDAKKGSWIVMTLFDCG